MTQATNGRFFDPQNPFQQTRLFDLTHEDLLPEGYGVVMMAAVNQEGQIIPIKERGLHLAYGMMIDTDMLPESDGKVHHLDPEEPLMRIDHLEITGLQEDRSIALAIDTRNRAIGKYTWQLTESGVGGQRAVTVLTVTPESLQAAIAVYDHQGLLRKQARMNDATILYPSVRELANHQLTKNNAADLRNRRIKLEDEQARLEIFGPNEFGGKLLQKKKDLVARQLKELGFTKFEPLKI